MLVRILAICLLLGWTMAAGAWGPTGHRVSARIAEEYLSDSAKQAITSLIGAQPLAQASTWADEMRSNPSKFWQQQAGPWHYVTVPSRKRYADVGPPPQGDALTALSQFREILLRPSASQVEKQLAFRFSLHIIADLHQPLHVGNGKDRGGNEIKLRYMGRSTNLHRLWDSDLIRQQELSYSEWADWLSRAITEDDVQTWMEPDPLVWVKESADLRRRVYPGSKEVGYDYGYEHLPALRKRLQQAGVRIAAYFNDLFPGCAQAPQAGCDARVSGER